MTVFINIFNISTQNTKKFSLIETLRVTFLKDLSLRGEKKGAVAVS